MYDEEDLTEEEESEPISADGKDVETALVTAALDFDTELKMLFANDPRGYKILRTIGAFIMRGQDLRAACILSRIKYDQFEILMLKHDAIADFITFKQHAYKASLVNVLTGAATTGAKIPKIAGYLLENQYRDDFGKKTKDDKVRPPDALEQALEAVRENGDSQPLVRPSLPAPVITPSRAL